MSERESFRKNGGKSSMERERVKRVKLGMKTEPYREKKGKELTEDEEKMRKLEKKYRRGKREMAGVKG